MVTTPIPHPDQVRLEKKAAGILATKPDPAERVETVFGPMEDWVFEIGEDWKLLLIPFASRWWYFDRIHDDWQDTGHGTGEVIFLVKDGLLQAVPVSSYEPSSPKGPHFCTQCGASVQEGDRYCRGCGMALRA